MSRTIPTHVGRTHQLADGSGMAPDHPHARGENAAVRTAAELNLGPSPRTWGEPGPGCRLVYSRRTIPTHVGRTRSISTEADDDADHPHARGENPGFPRV